MMEEMAQKSQIELLAGRLMKSQNAFDALKLQTQAKKYDDVATSKQYAIKLMIILQIVSNLI